MRIFQLALAAKPKFKILSANIPRDEFENYFKNFSLLVHGNTVSANNFKHKEYNVVTMRYC